MANRYGPLVLKKLAKAQEILGYEFHDITWLREGLDITKPKGHAHAKNKRLALVGDHKIASIFIDRWYGKNDLFSVDWSEIRAANFSNQKFTEISYRNGLSNCTIPEAMLRLPGGKIPDSAVRIMSDTLEALLGAIYTDAKDNNHPDPYGEVEKAALRLGLADRRLMTAEELRWSVENLRSQRKLPPRMFTGHQFALASAVHELDRPAPSRPPGSQIHSIAYDRILEYIQAAPVLREALLAKAQQARLRLRMLNLPKLKPLPARLRLHALGLQKLRPWILLKAIWEQPANLRRWTHAALRVFVDPFDVVYASIKTALTPVPRHLAARRIRAWSVINLTLHKEAEQRPALNKIHLASVKTRVNYHRARKRYQQARKNYKKRILSFKLGIADRKRQLRDAVTQRINRIVAIRTSITTKVARARANLRTGVVRKVKKSVKAKNRAISGLKRFRLRVTKSMTRLFRFKATTARYRAAVSRRLPRLFQRQANVTPVATKAVQGAQPQNKVGKELEAMASPSVLSAQASEPMGNKQTMENIKSTDDRKIPDELRKVAKVTEGQEEMRTKEKEDDTGVEEGETRMKKDQRQMQEEAGMTMRLIGLHEAGLRQAMDPQGAGDDALAQTLEETKRADDGAAKLTKKQLKKQAKKQAKLDKQRQQVEREAEASVQETRVKQSGEEREAEQSGPQEQNVKLTPEEKRFKAGQAFRRPPAKQGSAHLKGKQDQKTDQLETDTKQLKVDAGKEVESAQNNEMKQVGKEAQPTEQAIQEEEKASQVQPKEAIPVPAGGEAGTLAQAEKHRLQQTDEQAMRSVDNATLHITSTEDPSSQDLQVVRLGLEPPPPSLSLSSPADSPETTELFEMKSAAPIQSKPQAESGQQVIMLNNKVVHALIKQRAKALQAIDPTLATDMSHSVVKAALEKELKLSR